MTVLTIEDAIYAGCVWGNTAANFIPYHSGMCACMNGGIYGAFFGGITGWFFYRKKNLRRSDNAVS